MAVGAAVAGIGGLLTWATYSAATSSGGGSYFVFYGAIGVGLWQFLVGAIQFINYARKSPEARARDELMEVLRVLLFAMIAVSESDGRVSDEEVTVIRAIIFELVGQDIGAKTVLDAQQQLADSDMTARDLIREHRHKLHGGFDRVIVQACYLVLAADGEVDETEMDALRGIALSLGIARPQLEAITAELKTA